MTATSVRIRAKDGGNFEAWLAVPSVGRGPGLIVLADVYNAKPWVRSVADGYPPYHPEAAALARRRTREFLEMHLGGTTS